jgi:hypothetical protein
MKSQNFVALRGYRDSMQMLSIQEIEDNPSLFVFMRLVELFQEFDLPVEQAGKIDVQVGNDFFEDKKMANDIILAYVKYCEHIYTMLCERVKDKEKVSQIFGDFVGSYGLYWYGVPEISPEEFDEDDY